MARFKFKLETVLRHRRMLEDDAQRELAKVLRQRMIFGDQLRQMQQTIVDSRQELGSSLVGKVDLEQVSSFARFSIQARQRAQSIVVRLAGIEKQIEAARQKLLEATKKRKALELLEERQRKQWNAEADRKENVELDDISLQGFIRASRAEVAE